MAIDHDGGALEAPEDLTIGAAGAFREALLRGLEREAGLTVDLSAVVEVDTAGLQLLLAARREAQGRDRELRLAGASEALREAVAALGLGERLGFVEAAAGEER